MATVCVWSDHATPSAPSVMSHISNKIKAEIKAEAEAVNPSDHVRKCLNFRFEFGQIHRKKRGGNPFPTSRNLKNPQKLGLRVRFFKFGGGFSIGYVPMR